ncbi:diversity-generating retroelement protein Avd [Brevibacillus sp. B_LB10_24]|uniref:diversity-generating retroelement protein Avd n=1 Tax=Brevibacillus sp. B_LB10_24 TaxID=3380645 RepID=UPI0038BCCFB2
MDELLLYKKTEVLLLDCYPVIRNFPKAEKFALCQEIKQAFYRMLRNITIANNVKSRRRALQEEIDADIKLLLVLFNVALSQKYLSKGKHYQIQVKLSEIGRILGGWMRSS